MMRLQPKASYLIVGGLGGIGRSICHWMADHGAKHIAVLSRSATANGSSGALIKKLASAGVVVTPIACDVSDAAALSTAISEYESTMPKIRGVIQGAMVLAVSQISNSHSGVLFANDVFLPGCGCRKDGHR